jgi:DNA-binding transcriptional regulator YbjK
MLSNRSKRPKRPSVRSATTSGDASRGARRREAIIEGAVRVIARDGVRGATHRAVAAEADVPLAATTYYFSSRDELVAAAFHHLAAREITELEEGIGELPERMSPDLAAAVLASIVADDLRAHREQILAEHEMHLEAGRTPALRDIHRRWSDAALAFFVAAARAAGTREPELDGALVLAVVSGIQLGELADPSKHLERDILGPLLRRLLRALA